jgi:hypothetical protein
MWGGTACPRSAQPANKLQRRRWQAAQGDHKKRPHAATSERTQASQDQLSFFHIYPIPQRLLRYDRSGTITPLAADTRLAYEATIRLGGHITAPAATSSSMLMVQADPDRWRLGHPPQLHAHRPAARTGMAIYEERVKGLCFVFRAHLTFPQLPHPLPGQAQLLPLPPIPTPQNPRPSCRSASGSAPILQQTRPNNHRPSAPSCGDFHVSSLVDNSLIQVSTPPPGVPSA